MSLRARLIAGMVVVSFVLVAVAFIIARTTEANLVDRVDQQLVQARTQLPPGRRGASAAAAPAAVDRAHVGLRVRGSRTASSIRCSSAERGHRRRRRCPEVTVARAMDAARAGDAFTVSSTSGSGRYRVMALRVAGRRSTSSASRCRTSTRPCSRLRWVLVAAIAIVIGILGVVVFWVLRLGVRPLKRMTKTAGAIAAGDLSRAGAGRSRGHRGA